MSQDSEADVEASVDDHVGTSISVLGALEVVRDGERVHLVSGQQRRLLAVLLTRANEVVSTDRLVDILWGDRDRSGVTREPLRTNGSEPGLAAT